MNSEAHDKCGEWIMGKFRQYGLTVIPQNVTLTGFDGTPLKCTNIVASYRPELTTRILLCAIGTAVRGPTTTLTRPTGVSL